MRRPTRWTVLGLAIMATMLLPFAGSSCGQSACLLVSQDELQKSGGVCPSKAKALPRFTDPGCGTPVSSVDGPGSVDGELCCYPVTEMENMGCMAVIPRVDGGGPCSPDGGPCGSDPDCCGGFCGGNGVCSGGMTVCHNDGEACSADNDCCISLCFLGVCNGNQGQCGINGDPCKTPNDCCSGFCNSVVNQCM
jgi:hypothetical protein